MTTRKEKGHRSGRVTRKGSKVGVTVEGLQSSFEKIDKKVRDMVARGNTDTQLAICIQKSWENQFHTELSSTAVKGLLSHYRATTTTGKRKTRKKQRGGMAPLSWTLGQGITAPVYGRFPVEEGAQPSVVKSLDRFYESPIGRACDSTGGYPAPTQTGGGIFDALANGHAPASIPHNMLESTVSAIQGRPISNPNPSPVTANPPLSEFQPQPFNPSAISQITTMAPVYPSY